MGTISDESAFRESIQTLLVEIMQNSEFGSDDSEDDDEDDYKNTPPKKKRYSIKIKDYSIKETKLEFVERILKIEQSAEIVEGEWDFDPIAFGNDQKIGGQPLVVFVWHLIKINEWHTQFGLDYKKLICFLYQIQEGYEDNLYHNKYHAIDVV